MTPSDRQIYRRPTTDGVYDEEYDGVYDRPTNLVYSLSVVGKHQVRTQAEYEIHTMSKKPKLVSLYYIYLISSTYIYISHINTRTIIVSIP